MTDNEITLDIGAGLIKIKDRILRVDVGEHFGRGDLHGILEAKGIDTLIFEDKGMDQELRNIIFDHFDCSKSTIVMKEGKELYSIHGNTLASCDMSLLSTDSRIHHWITSYDPIIFDENKEAIAEFLRNIEIVTINVDKDHIIPHELYDMLATKSFEIIRK